MRQNFSLSVVLVCCFALSGEASVPWSDLNIVVVTDVHSWISGHKHQEEFDVPRDANYGDLFDFYSHLKQEAAQTNKDILLVNNGDIVDGTGLSFPYGFDLTPLLQLMPFDLVNTGNHELYQDVTIQNINSAGGFADSFKGRYVTSNVLNSTTGQNLGTNFTILNGSASGRQYATFGFLYNMQNHCPAVIVKTVENAIIEPWFHSALQQGEAAIILAHMDVKHPLVYTILQRIRGLMGSDYPVVFLTGHTHYRGYEALDDYAVSFEAGHYFDTVGFISVGLPGSAVPANAKPQFSHLAIDANRATLASVAGVSLDALETPNGTQIKAAITEVRNQLNLDERLGCNPSTLSHYEDPIWDIYTNEVLPSKLNIQVRDLYVSLISRGGFRYNLYKGDVTRDDIITLSPFHDKFYVARDVPGSIVTQLLADNTFSDFAKSNTTIVDNYRYSVIAHQFDKNKVEQALQMFSYNGILVEYPTSLDSTSIWLNWVPEAWPCESYEPPACTGNGCQGESNAGGNDDTEVIAVTVSVILFLVVAGAIGAIIYFLAPCLKRPDSSAGLTNEQKVAVQQNSVIGDELSNIEHEAEIGV